ncbi:unnamed protein product [Closterium sp. Naga37s-1]|nr:unnamed protein product [Closterium sp. Naga37s-1]
MPASTAAAALAAVRAARESSGGDHGASDGEDNEFCSSEVIIKGKRGGAGRGGRIRAVDLFARQAAEESTATKHGSASAGFVDQSTASISKSKVTTKAGARGSVKSGSLRGSYRGGGAGRSKPKSLKEYEAQLLLLAERLRLDDSPEDEQAAAAAAARLLLAAGRMGDPEAKLRLAAAVLASPTPDAEGTSVAHAAVAAEVAQRAHQTHLVNAAAALSRAFSSLTDRHSHQHQHQHDKTVVASAPNDATAIAAPATAVSDASLTGSSATSAHDPIPNIETALASIISTPEPTQTEAASKGCALQAIPSEEECPSEATTGSKSSNPLEGSSDSSRNLIPNSNSSISSAATTSTITSGPLTMIVGCRAAKASVGGSSIPTGAPGQASSLGRLNWLRNWRGKMGIKLKSRASVISSSVSARNSVGGKPGVGVRSGRVAPSVVETRIAAEVEELVAAAELAVEAVEVVEAEAGKAGEEAGKVGDKQEGEGVKESQSCASGEEGGCEENLKQPLGLDDEVFVAASAEDVGSSVADAEAGSLGSTEAGAVAGTAVASAASTAPAEEAEEVVEDVKEEDTMADAVAAAQAAELNTDSNIEGARTGSAPGSPVAETPRGKVAIARAAARALLAAAGAALVAGSATKERVGRRWEQQRHAIGHAAHAVLRRRQRDQQPENSNKKGEDQGKRLGAGGFEELRQNAKVVDSAANFV